MKITSSEIMYAVFIGLGYLESTSKVDFNGIVNDVNNWTIGFGQNKTLYFKLVGYKSLQIIDFHESELRKIDIDYDEVNKILVINQALALKLR